VVPSAAIQTGLNGSLFVWLVDTDAKGKQVAKMQPVNVALAEGQSTILDSGPEPGAKVVLDGADRLRTGQPVTATAARQRGSQSAGPGAGHGAGRATDQGPTQNSSPFTGGAPGDRPESAGQNRQNPGSNPRQQQ
jgi:multidrug efflux system membrane fusion protein